MNINAISRINQINQTNIDIDAVEDIAEEVIKINENQEKQIQEYYNNLIEEMNVKSQNYTLTLGEQAMCQTGMNFDLKG